MKLASKDWTLAGCLILLNLVFFSEALFSKMTFFARDLSVFHYPLKRLVTESFARGEWPLWNPYVQMGQPLLANPNALALYPTQIIFQLLPFEIAFEFHLVLHCIIAGTAAFFLARKLSLSRQESFLSAVIYNFGGITLSSINLFNILPVVAFLPLLTVLMIRVFEFPGWWSLLVAGCSLGCFFLLLEPLSSLGTVCFVFLIVTLFVSFQKERPKKNLNIAMLLCLPVVIGVLIASVQILPSLELARHSGRRAGLSFEAASFWSLHPINLLQTIFPRVFGEYFKLNAPIPWAGRFFENREPYFLSCYFGLIPMSLAMIGATAWKGQPEIRRISLGLVIALLLAFGKYTPVYGWIFSYFPVLQLGRYPIKFMLVANLGIALLAGFGWKRIEHFRAENDSRVTPAIRIMIFVVCIVFLASAILLNTRSWELLRLATIDGSGQSLAWPKFKLKIPASVVFEGLRHLQLQLLLILMTTVLVIRKKASVFASLGLITFVPVDLFASNAWINPLINSEFYRPSPVALYLQRQENQSEPFRVFRLEPSRLQDHPAVFYQTDSVIWLSIYRNLSLYPMLAAKDHVQYALFPSIDQLETSASQGTIRALADAETLQEKLLILRGLNVRYVISPVPLNHDMLTLEAVFQINSDQPLRLFRLLDYSPRVFLADKRRNEVDSPLPHVDERNAFPQSKLEVAQYDANYLRLKAVVERDADLVLLDNAYPGWRGFVDGRECQVRLYQQKYRLLAIPAGHHEVSFRFDPQSFRYGLWISGLTLLSCFGVSTIVILRSSTCSVARTVHHTS